MDPIRKDGVWWSLWCTLASTVTVIVVVAATVDVCSRAARPDPECGAADRERIRAAEVLYLRQMLDRAEAERLAVRTELDQLRRGAMLWPVGRSGQPGELPEDLIPKQQVPTAPKP